MKISKGYISVFGSSLGEGRELPKEIKGVNLNNNSSIEKMVNNYLKIEHKLWSDSMQLKVKESFRYGINYWPDQDLLNLYNEVLPQIVLPTNVSIREFYLNVWNLMFDNENIELLSFDYIEIPELDIYS
ncbi:hypothetical protein CUZ56_02708 [Saezia sanguinis]|uniref:Uncharacterized protein n=1 Tax=Saezia sanguinis TaxID=1965230 RepID=A0A433SA79_9BURK|nr:hypothetical protein [Saezia sanguinis]RUS65622.1 hypothetical protein CUZ56_02708 [Saezia sanguinis]